MKLSYVSKAGVQVVLSRRNLEHLIGALDRAGGEQTPYLVRECVDQNGETYALRVFAEPDEAHYRDREPGPGFENFLNATEGDTP